MILQQKTHQGVTIRQGSPAFALKASLRLTPLVITAIVVLSSMPDAGSAQTPKTQTLVERFYRERNGKPAWTEWGDLKFSAFAVLGLMRRAPEFGLNPSDYLLDELEVLLNATDTVAESEQDRYWWAIDSLFTVAAFRFFRDAVEGRVRSESVDFRWISTKRPIDWVSRMNGAADSGRISGVLDDLEPADRGYRLLRSALLHYQRLADDGDWEAIADGPLLAPGSASDRVPALRRRLAAEGFLTTTDAPDTTHFDYTLAAGMIRFQRARGLVGDGIVGPRTVAELNISAADRAAQIRLNIERWRWLPPRLGDRHIMVNIAGAELRLVDTGQTISRHRAIVGRVDWRTPIVSSKVTKVLFRPVWRIPKSIATTEILRLVKRNPSYLDRENIKVYREGTSEPVDPAGIDWSKVSPKSLGLRFEQEPGPSNPLGGAKLVFDSPFGVYLHDTPFQQAFSAPRRLESHGCVRVEGMPELLSLLLPAMTAAEIGEAMAAGRERSVELEAPVDIHLAYWTAWVDDSGQVQFRRDAYGWDQKLGEAITRQSQLRRGFRERVTTVTKTVISVRQAKHGTGRSLSD